MSGEIFSCQLAGGGIVDAKDAAGHPTNAQDGPQLRIIRPHMSVVLMVEKLRSQQNSEAVEQRGGKTLAFPLVSELSE